MRNLKKTTLNLRSPKIKQCSSVLKLKSLQVSELTHKIVSAFSTVESQT
jgi:hypothetical protein